MNPKHVHALSWRLAVLATSLSCAGCAVSRQMLAAPDDWVEYRAFRAATHEGPRLARAQKYLEHHPRGAWVEEVRSAFEAEESAWFENAKATRSGAREYLIDLPDGPHAEAARAVLATSDEESDLDMLLLLAAARQTSAMLDLQAERRNRVSEFVLEEIAALIDPATAGAGIDNPPRTLAHVLLQGAARPTWGTGRVAQVSSREDDLYFALPTPQGGQARMAEVRLRLLLSRGRVTGGMIEGDDLFVRWTEATQLRPLDPGDATDRAAAAEAVASLLAGAVEGRLPASRCAARPAPGEIFTRSCGGWHMSVRMGDPPANHDVIAVAVQYVASRGKAR